MVARADTFIEHAFPAAMPELAQCSLLCATDCPNKEMHCPAEDPHHIPLIHVDWPNSSSTDQLNPGDRCAPGQIPCISCTPYDTLGLVNTRIYEVLAYGSFPHPAADVSAILALCLYKEGMVHVLYNHCTVL